VKAGGPRAPATSFMIKHSFADAHYDCEGFITQNKQSHLPDFAIATMGLSTIPFVAADCAMTALQAAQGSVSAAPAEDASKRGSLSKSKAVSTAGFLMTKTRTQINTLFEKMASTEQVSFALCLTTTKSCKEGAPKTVNQDYLRDQCKHLALPSLISFAQQGYAYNKTYEEFYLRFRAALPFAADDLPYPHAQYLTKITANAVDLSKKLVASLLPLIMNHTSSGSKITEVDEPVNGKTCIFIRERLFVALEEYRTSFLKATLTIALTLQSVYRMRKDRAMYSRVKLGTIAFQSFVRRRIGHQKFQSKRSLVNKMKSLYRMQKCRKSFVLLSAAVIFIKAKLRGGMLQRIRYKRLQRAKLCLQGLGRGLILRCAAINTFAAMCRMQRAARTFLNYRRHNRLCLSSALRIQNKYRGFAVRSKYHSVLRLLAIKKDQRVAHKVVRCLQAIWRRKLVQRRFAEVLQAAVKVQARFRTAIQRKSFAKLTKLVLWLQCIGRRIAAQNKAHTIVVTKMVETELALLSDLFQREVSSIRAIPNQMRSLGCGYLRSGLSKFERFLISFDVNFDLSFAYPNGWLSSVLDFSRTLRDQEKHIISKIVSGSHHTVILDDCNNIYTFGLGDLGQLGHNSRTSYPLPHKIDKLAQYLSSANSAGNSIPSALSSSAGKGSSGPGAASIGISRSLGGANVSVKDICCGRDHTLLLTG
jgi:hypothetical protein